MGLVHGSELPLSSYDAILALKQLPLLDSGVCHCGQYFWNVLELLPIPSFRPGPLVYANVFVSCIISNVSDINLLCILSLVAALDSNVFWLLLQRGYVDLLPAPSLF